MPETNLNNEKGESSKKGIFGKFKESVDDKEEQLAIFSTFVRLGILIWSGSILTLAYIKLPNSLGIPEQKLDPTFIASVFTGVLATFGVQAAKKNGNGNGNGGISKEDLEKLINAAAQTAPSQTIRVEQGPIRFENSEPIIKPVPTDPSKPPYSL
tara:strand:+ start:68 stop:532 length:465 start_codon:yes stop_codon:yes gene_type:complete